MAVTNAMLIENYKVSHNITVPLHTYAKWQQLGYQVKKGEKSEHRIVIWKACTKKKRDEKAFANANEESEIIIESKHMIMKESCFFTINQVEKIAEKV